jgi:hypothetical protein
MPALRKISSQILIVFALAAGPSAGLAQDKPDAPTPKESGASVLQSRANDKAADPAQSSSNGNGHSSNPGASDPKAADPKASDPNAVNPAVQKDENTKRILGFIPNFQSKDDIPVNQAPLSPREKYVLAYRQTVDFSAHVGNLFQAALQQASNGQPHYGQGWGPYAQRFGAAEADQVTSAFFIFGFLPHVLHDDPRYFRKRYGSVWSRIKYSASRTVITRTDAGNSTFNVPQVAGQLLQQSISTAYYPEQDRSASGVFQNCGVNLAYNSVYNVLKEFYPDFLRIVFHRHTGAQSATPAPPPPDAAGRPVAQPANP